MEPALGSISERLDILIRRFGGHTSIRLTRQERLELDSMRGTFVPVAVRLDNVVPSAAKSGKTPTIRELREEIDARMGLPRVRLTRRV
jgi:hypothetical protein